MGSSVDDHDNGRVLVLGTDDRVVLAIARSLGRQGIEVHVGWCAPTSLARKSRYVSVAHDIAAYRPDDAAWKHELIALLEREPFDLILPCNDSTLVPLQLHRADFARFPALHLHEPQVFDVVFDKLRSYELAQSVGVCVPRGRTVRSDEDRAAAMHLQLPVVVKPRATFTEKNSGASNVVVRAKTAGELARLLDSPACQDACLVQEVFPGTGVGVELLVDGGRILAAFQHRRLRETMEFGSSYRESVPLDAALLEASGKLMRAVDYTGVAMVEFIQNQTTGEWAFLEINGRFWGSLPLAVAAGADFPFYLYEYWVRGRRDFPSEYRLGLKYRNLLLDVQNRRGRAPGWRGTLQSGGHLISILWRVLTRQDGIDTLAFDDPRPALGELAKVGLRMIAKLAELWRGQRPGAIHEAPSLSKGEPRKDVEQPIGSC